ncbi:MFS transporter, partial [Amycolatopsis sp. SID8362]|nr:MFS transporter [Amycolatopsis sp. SID8362]NED43478.1 MFS transporter [Amycolatopsis sp. SID8362]
MAAPGAGGVLGAAAAVRLARRWGSARSLLVVLLVLTPFGLLIPLAAPGPGLVLPVVGGAGIGAAVVAANVLAAG